MTAKTSSSCTSSRTTVEVVAGLYPSSFTTYSMLRPLMPPLSLTYSKYAFVAAEIDE